VQGKPVGCTASIRQRRQEELQMYKLDLTSLCSNCQSQCESNSSFSVATKGLDKGCAQYYNRAAVILLSPDTFHLRELAAPPLLLPETWRTSLTTEMWVSVKLERGDTQMTHCCHQ